MLITYTCNPITVWLQVCVCVRERERERESAVGYVYLWVWSRTWVCTTQKGKGGCNVNKTDVYDRTLNSKNTDRFFLVVWAHAFVEQGSDYLCGDVHTHQGDKVTAEYVKKSCNQSKDR